MIVVDYSNIAFSTVTAMELPAEEGILRHAVLNSLRSIYAKHKEQYGPEMVLACDSGSWRRKVFPEYKWARRQNRSEHEAYWSEVFRILNVIRDEIKANLPWKVVAVPDAEADDVIAALCINTQTFGNMDNVLIVGGDSDYKQLLRYPNVRQFSNQQKKFVTEDDPQRWLFEAILTGQKAKDGIPNIRTRDDFFLTKEAGDKQLPITKKYIEEAWQHRNDLDKYLSASDYRNYVRNRTLIDFAAIPESVINAIIEEWEAQPSTSTGLILPYLMSRQLNQLIERLKDFYPSIT